MTIAASTDSSAPLVVVVGGTGKQGGSVIQELIRSETPYRLRTVTRNRQKPVAIALQEEGVEVIETSLTSDNEVGARKAFEGADIIFIVTDFWEHGDKQRETVEGKMLVDAANASHVKLVVWSGLESVTKVSKGRLTHVAHFDSKASITEHARESGIPFVDVQAGVYAQNYLNWRFFTKRPDGAYVLSLPCSPNTRIPIIDIVSDYGIFVRRVIEDFYAGALEIGSSVYTYGEYITYPELTEQLAQLTGKTVLYEQITPEEFMNNIPSLHMVAKEELTQMHQYFDEFGYYGAKEIESLAGLPRTPLTWSEFVSANLECWKT